MQDGAIVPNTDTEFYNSQRGRVSTACFNTLFKYNIVISEIADLLRIIDPESMANNVETYRIKRDNATPKQTKIFYHNRIKDLFRSAECLLSNINAKDEQFFNLNKEDIRELLSEKRNEYEVNTYRRAIIKNK